MNIGERFEALCAANQMFRPKRTIAGVVSKLAWEPRASTRNGEYMGRWGWFVELRAATFIPCSEHEAEATIVAHMVASHHSKSIGDVLDMLLPVGVRS